MRRGVQIRPSFNPVLERNLRRQTYLHSAGLGGLGSFCSDQTAWGTTAGLLDVGAGISYGGWGSSESTTTSTRATVAAGALAAGSDLIQTICGATQGQATSGGTVSGSTGNADYDKLVRDSNANMSAALDATNANILNMQAQQAAQSRTMLMVGGGIALAIAAVFLLKK